MDVLNLAMISSLKRKRPTSASQEGKGSLKIKKMNVSSKKRPANSIKGSKTPTDGKKKSTIEETITSIKVKEPEKKPEKLTIKKLETKASSQKSDAPKAKDTSNSQVKRALDKCKELSKRVQVLYGRCVTVIKDVPEDTWPRKPKMNMVKVSIKVPENKKSGDTIIFNNPHIGGQKLKVQIPEKVSVGDTFRVSVPTADTKNVDDLTQNKLPKDLVRALYDYSCMYDEWTQATGTFILYLSRVFKSIRNIPDGSDLFKSSWISGYA